MGRAQQIRRVHLLGTLRSGLVQLLLEACASIKEKRLFLHLAEKHAHPWFKQLDLTKVSLGSGKRVLVPGGRPMRETRFFRGRARLPQAQEQVHG